MAMRTPPPFDDEPRLTVQRAIRAGLRVIPPREDGSKAPETELVNGRMTWEHWRATPPSVEQLRAWYGPRTGVGIATGAASGNLELLEFDDADVYRVFRDTAEAAGLHELVDRIEAGYLERTPSGGIHWLYRCEVVTGNTKLARREGVSEDGERRVIPLIETKGEGGYVIIAPSHGTVHPTGHAYELVHGSVESIATITPEERESLWQLARAFDELPKVEYQPTAKPGKSLVHDRPGEDFNQRATWQEVLEPCGWTLVSMRGAVGFWRRPGKQHGVSATTNYHDSDLLYVFSTSTPFESEQGYSKWRAYAILRHGGDFAAAARDLAGQGFGAAPLAPILVFPSGESTTTEPTPFPGASDQVPSFNLTDTGNAERLVAQHGDDLRYCELWNKWLTWDGRRWAIDDTGEVHRRAKQTVYAIAADAARLKDDPNQRQLYANVAKWAKASQSERARSAIVRLAQKEPTVSILPDVLDTDPWLLSVANGTLDLRSGELLSHDRDHLITRIVPVAFDPDAACPTFDRFLARITCTEDGAERPELIDFLQRSIGYALTGTTIERVMFILYGSGRNGKSTLLDVVRRILGDYAMRVPTETLMAKRNESIPNDIARLKGARFVFASETDDGRRLSEALIKDITGGDTISARFMRGEWFDFRPEFKVWLATNHRPTIRGTDNAIWDRIRLIPFDVRIPDAELDRDLPMKLDWELPGILAWAVRGCIAWQREGLPVPPAVQAATAAYRSSMDVLAAWIDDCCVVDRQFMTPANDLYESYRRWCESTGERALPRRTFGMRLSERGFESAKSTGGKRVWQGVALAGESSQTTLAAPSTNGHASPSLVLPGATETIATGILTEEINDEPTF